tara:strand:- start:18586 stop:19998 length:1413 start_codon:yes stop_codon:yes gene_type:complete
MNKVFEKENEIIEGFHSIGQEQIFRFWKELTRCEREHLLGSISKISPSECQLAWNDMQIDQIQISNPQEPKATTATNPLCSSLLKFREQGEELLRLGKVAAFTVAGGQGTRLGHSGPKGTYPCTPISNISLFEKFAQNIRFFAKRYEQFPWWFIMTSQENHDETIDFFKKNNFYGLEKERVKFFQQGEMPVFDLNGKIILKKKYQVLTSPNGHGGSFGAISDSGALKIMENEGIEIISYFQVDNPLVYCLDPAFIGLHQMEKSEMSSKAVEKVNADEKVGTFLKLDDKLHVVEYSDIPKDMSIKQKEDGKLCYRLGSIAIHLINRTFIKSLTDEKESKNKRLKYHGAFKPVDHIDENGNHVIGKSPNALKAETFVFDALPLAQNPLVLEVNRGEEFAPIKNAQGIDSIESSQKLQVLRAKKWLKKTGYSVKSEKSEILSSFAPTWPHFMEHISNPSELTQFFSSQDIQFD